MLAVQNTAAQIALQTFVRRRAEIDGGARRRLSADAPPPKTLQDAAVHRLYVHGALDRPRLYNVLMVVR
jgi:hypothetical protein